MSTSLSDCTPDLTGLAACDVDTLRDWVLKFSAKYPIVGTLADADEEGDHAAGHESKQQQQPAPAAAAADDKKIK